MKMNLNWYLSMKYWTQKYYEYILIPNLHTLYLCLLSLNWIKSANIAV